MIFLFSVVLGSALVMVSRMAFACIGCADSINPAYLRLTLLFWVIPLGVVGIVAFLIWRGSRKGMRSLDSKQPQSEQSNDSPDSGRLK